MVNSQVCHVCAYVHVYAAKSTKQKTMNYFPIPFNYFIRPFERNAKEKKDRKQRQSYLGHINTKKIKFLNGKPTSTTRAKD